MRYKLEEKLFLSKAIISNVHSMRLKSRFTESENNEELVDESIQLAILMLEKRTLLFGESPKKDTPKKEINTIDFEEVIKIFNNTCSDLPQVTKSTKDRQNLILKILEIYTPEDIGKVFTNVSESDYLSGRKKGTTWKANFDWILSPDNFIKILEGNYKNVTNGNGNNRSTRTDNELKQSVNDTVNKLFGVEQPNRVNFN